MFDVHWRLSLPICLDDLWGAVGGTFLHDGHPFQKRWSGRNISSEVFSGTVSCDDDTKSKKLYLMWSYFLKRALYSTARCCSSTSMLLPYIETTFLIRLQRQFVKLLVVGEEEERERERTTFNRSEQVGEKQRKISTHLTLVKRVDSFMIAVRE